MKDYTVYFIIKKNRHGYLNQETVTAKNQREAVSSVRKSVRKNSGKTAFNATCKVPEKTSKGMVWNGLIYMGYDDTFHQLW